MSEQYRHLGVYSDWVDAARQQHPLYGPAAPGAETRARVREVLGFCDRPESPLDVQVDGRWEADGVAGEAVSWSVGYGPRTEAWVLKPAGASGPLPGIVALHDHGGFKSHGKEKIADGPEPPDALLRAWRVRHYGARAYPNALARQGFVVLVHDVFLWGSRRFPLEAMPDEVRGLVDATESRWWPSWRDQFEAPYEAAYYNAAASHHESSVEKYCNVLGTTLAGVVSHEDRIAVAYLQAREDVARDRVGCLGLSGGGNRAALLQATCDGIAAAGIVGLMSTYAALLDHHMGHTWMLFPSGWARYGDWPDLAACRAPSPLLVQYDLDDGLFTPQGMRAADARIAAHYTAVGSPDAYAGQFYPGPHKFDLAMQAAAFDWFAERLG